MGGSAAQTWYLADHLGSIMAGYDATPTIGTRTDYGPFGVPDLGTGLVASLAAYETERTSS